MKTYVIVIIVSIVIISIGIVLYFSLSNKDKDKDVQFVDEAYTTSPSLTSRTVATKAGSEPQAPLGYSRGNNDFPTVLLNNNIPRPDNTICPESSKDHYKSTCEWDNIDTAKTNCDNMDGTNNHNACIGFFKDDDKFYAMAEPEVKTIYSNNRTSRYG
tara:strand:- start:28 stop:501 length:474 start_codon:yes stop_codon:yes gene_type:complete